MSLVTLPASSELQRHQANVDQANQSRSTVSPRSREEHLAAQLGCLASQHHTSEYNCLKFGPKGAPAQYVPLSVQAPEYYRQLQNQQARHIVSQAWWISHRPGDSANLICDGRADASEANAPFSCSGLQDELLSAMSSPLSPQIVAPTEHIPIVPAKTSHSHPINISFLIPVELIPIISTHLAYLDQHSSPVLFDIPLAYQLHRLVSVPAVRPSPAVTTYSKPKLLPVPAISLSNWRHVTLVPNIAKHAHPRPYVNSQSHADGGQKQGSEPNIPRTPGLVNFLWNQKIARAGKAVISTSYGFKIPGLPSIPISPPPSGTSGPSACSPESGDTKVRNHWQQPYVSTKNTCAAAFSASAKVQKHKQPPPCALDVRMHATVVSSDDKPPVAPGEPTVRNDRKNSLDRHIEKSQLLAPSQPSVDARLLGETDMALHRSASAPDSILKPQMGHATASRKVTLGNLYLSSCPGKKVRLNGPVNGRGTVCRDLLQDLQRMKDIGVGCVVCCLDDEELSFLGAPWNEYSRAADQIGLDILRIPTPEGLAPTEPGVLDAHLTRLIETYTLAGTPILVHCRGGVGRAGIVACCWALKLGLCGWIETQPGAGDGAPAIGVDVDTGRVGIRRDTMQLVERVITLVRRRRSAKAVETYEQVRFLVEYVDFLRTKARVTRMRREEGEKSTGCLSTSAVDRCSEPWAMGMCTRGLGVDMSGFTVGSAMESDIRTQAQDPFPGT